MIKRTKFECARVRGMGREVKNFDDKLGLTREVSRPVNEGRFLTEIFGRADCPRRQQTQVQTVKIFGRDWTKLAIKYWQRRVRLAIYEALVMKQRFLSLKERVNRV